MAKEKNKPVAVRFDLKMLEILKEEEKVDTPQQALNFLTKFWENNRPAKADFGDGLKEAAATDRAIKKTPDPVVKAASDPVAKTTKNEPAKHPSGLSGIDLAIWKAEQKQKQ